jgi:hypothetical protein
MGVKRVGEESRSRQWEKTVGEDSGRRESEQKKERREKREERRKRKER